MKDKKYESIQAVFFTFLILAITVDSLVTRLLYNYNYNYNTWTTFKIKFIFIYLPACSSIAAAAAVGKYHQIVTRAHARTTTPKGNAS